MTEKPIMIFLNLKNKIKHLYITRKTQREITTTILVDIPENSSYTNEQIVDPLLVKSRDVHIKVRQVYEPEPVTTD